MNNGVVFKNLTVMTMNFLLTASNSSLHAVQPRSQHVVQTHVFGNCMDTPQMTVPIMTFQCFNCEDQNISQLGFITLGLYC